MTARLAKFRHIPIDGVRTAPTRQQLVQIERELGLPLPSLFRDFFVTAAGGHIEHVVDVRMADAETEELCFSSIFDADEVLREIPRHRLGMKIPNQVLPFARDGGGSTAYLDLTHDGAGRVVALVVGLPAWTGRPRETSFVEVASSFDAFLDLLRISRESLLDQLQNGCSQPSHVVAVEEWLEIALPSWSRDEEVYAAVVSARHRVARS